MASSQQAGRAAEGLEEPPPLLLRSNYCRRDLYTYHFTNSFTVNLLVCLSAC